MNNLADEKQAGVANYGATSPRGAANAAQAGRTTR